MSQAGGVKRIWGIIVVVATLLAGACAPPSPAPDGSIPQNPNYLSNGLIVDGDSLWVADLLGQQLIKFDPDTGRIVRRVGPSNGLVSPDDGVVMDDGSLVATSPVGDLVQQVALDGTVTVLARLSVGPNPIVRDPNDPAAVLVGDAVSNPSRLYRVFTDGRAPEVVVSGLPPINGFSFGPDGAIWAPTGGFASAIGSTGGIVRIDVANGTFQPFGLTFPGEPGKTGFAYDVSAKFGPDGQLYVLQGFDAAVYRVDPNTGVADRIANVPGGFGDNMAFTPDGRLFVSGFLGPVFEIRSDGTARTVPIGG